MILKLFLHYFSHPLHWILNCSIGKVVTLQVLLMKNQFQKSRLNHPYRKRKNQLLHLHQQKLQGPCRHPLHRLQILRRKNQSVNEIGLRVVKMTVTAKRKSAKVKIEVLLKNFIEFLETSLIQIYRDLLIYVYHVIFIK